jgi:hypothetical protein
MLTLVNREGVLHLEMGFQSTEKRAAWEMAFAEAKNKLCKSTFELFFFYLFVLCENVRLSSV